MVRMAMESMDQFWLEVVGVLFETEIFLNLRIQDQIKSKHSLLPSGLGEHLTKAFPM
jgi:hypothetical protein